MAADSKGRRFSWGYVIAALWVAACGGAFGQTTVGSWGIALFASLRRRLWRRARMYRRRLHARLSYRRRGLGGSFGFGRALYQHQHRAGGDRGLRPILRRKRRLQRAGCGLQLRGWLLSRPALSGSPKPPEP